MKCTCDGDNCSIGNPNPECIERGIMVHTECGRYAVEEVKSLFLDVDTLCELMAK